jgi:hypothetical protein
MRCSHCNLLLVAKNECAPASIIESRPSPPDEGFALFSVELDIIFPWTGTPDCARHVPYTVSANLTGNDLRLLRLHTDIAPQPICTRTIPAGSMSRPSSCKVSVKKVFVFAVAYIGLNGARLLGAKGYSIHGRLAARLRALRFFPTPDRFVSADGG